MPFIPDSQTNIGAKMPSIAPTTPVGPTPGFVPDSPNAIPNHGFFGNLLAQPVKIAARVGTNLVNAEQAARGVPATQPFSGGYLGNVAPIGQGFDVTKGLTPENIKALKDSVGSGLQVASYLPVGEATGLAADVFKQAGAGDALRAIKAAAIPLAKEGATAGGLAGAGGALQDNKGLGGVLGSAAGGAITGAAVAPLVGIGSAGIGKGIGKSTNLFRGVETKPLTAAEDAKVVSSIVDNTRDIQTPGVGSVNGKKAISGNGLAARYAKGEGTTTGRIFQDSTLPPTADEINRAQLIKQYWKPGATIDENIGHLNQAEKEISDNQMTPFLQKNGSPYDWQELHDYAMNYQPTSSTLLKNPVANDTYKQMMSDIVSHASKFSKDAEGIYNARKSIDQLVKKELGPTALADPVRFNAISQAAKDGRTMLENFNQDLLKYGDMTKVNKANADLKAFTSRPVGMSGQGTELSPAQYREAIYKNAGLNDTPEGNAKVLKYNQIKSQLQALIEGRQNMGIRQAAKYGTNSFTRFLKNNPNAKKAIYYGIPAAAGLIGLNKIFKSQ